MSPPFTPRDESSGPPGATEPRSFCGMVSRSALMVRAFEAIARLAPTPAKVLILGETGTGKELVARALHQASGRRGDFVAVNCAALPDHLLESELFGHERGAFTDADRRRIGRFERADEGTLFLDEIGELSLSLQAKLLRVLQDGTFERVGGVETLRSTARVIAATNKSLDREAATGHFRADLFYRLNGPRAIELPPLRDRPEDIPLLAEFLLNRLCEGDGMEFSLGATLAPSTLDALMAYRWPGNVRELEHALQHALALLDDGPILPGHLPPEVAPPDPPSRAADLLSADLTLGEINDALLGPVEREYFARLLALHGGNVAECARHCRMSRRIVSARLRELGLDYRDFRRPSSPASIVS